MRMRFLRFLERSDFTHRYRSDSIYRFPSCQTAYASRLNVGQVIWFSVIGAVLASLALLSALSFRSCSSVAFVRSLCALTCSIFITLPFPSFSKSSRMSSIHLYHGLPPGPRPRLRLQSLHLLLSDQCSDWAGLGRSSAVSRIAHAQRDDRPRSTCWDRTKAQLRWAGPSDETGPDRTGPVSHFNWPTRPRCSPTPVDQVQEPVDQV